MADRIRAIDWTSTPLGPLEQWPQSLKSAMSICMNSAFPTAIYWGADLLLLYNDAWAPIPAERHPWALGRPGREVWSDIWDTVGPQMEDVLASGEGFSAFDQLLWMERQGRPRETYWNYSFTPIIAEDGRVAGIFNQGHEVTQRTMGERRQQLLLRFSDEVRTLDDPREIIRTSQRLLGEQLNANRVGYGEVDSTERFFTTTDNWTNGVPPHHGTHDLAAFGEKIHTALRTGVPVVIEDAVSDPSAAGVPIQAALAALDIRAAITASLIKNGKMVAALYVHCKEPRSWSDGDVQMLHDFAERTWAELARARAEAQADASEERYRRLFEQTSDMILTADLEQVITDCNPCAAEAVGLKRHEAIGRRIMEFIQPEDLGITDEMLKRKLEKGGTTRYDVRVRGAQGQQLYWEINSGLTNDESGSPVGLHVVARDITERRRWERHQRLLVAELNHRVKNTLAIVQSLAHQTFGQSRPHKDAVSAYEGRLRALAAAHNLLTRENWEAASMRDIVADALSPFCADERCDVDGPDLRIPPQTAVSLALAVHELATNAAKYGSLSNDAGTIVIRWTLEDGKLDFVWTEAGGPPVSPPSSAGFGSRMIKRALASDLKGEVQLDFDETGVVCRVRAPVDHLAIAA